MVGLLGASCGAAVKAAAASLPPGFQEEVVVSGLDRPTAMAFSPDGRLFIAEQNGRIRVVTALGQLLPTPFATLPALTEHDRGLLGLALDPRFLDTGYVYVFYTTSNRPPSPPRSESTTNRVSRLTASGNVAVPGSEWILIDGIPTDSLSHCGGDLGFGADGKLFVSTGDGAGYFIADSLALRALNADFLNGKILRVDPATGAGLPDNPFYAGPLANRSKVWCLGLRNPFKFAVKPGTSTLFVNDVGWDGWEEIHVTAPGASFGWPCFEGPAPMERYQEAFPGTCGTATGVLPLYAYPHSGRDAAITGGEFVTTENYPAEYRGNYFFGDFPRNEIRRAVLGPNDELLAVLPFASGDFRYTPVDLAEGPDGNLYVLHFVGDFTIPSGSVERISWIGAGNHAPVARATATPSSGYAPLLVSFSSAASSDADGDALSTLWDFDDGSSSTEPNPSHVFTANGVYHVVLTVSDGQVARQATATVTVGSRPPRAIILSPGNGLPFVPGQAIALNGFASDVDDGVLSGTSLRWTVILHHHEHEHPYFDSTGASTTFVAQGHGNGDIHYEIVLSATDSSGLSGSDRIEILPAPNLALGRPATASSFVNQSDFRGQPEGGNDGIVVNGNGEVSGWHSMIDTGVPEWWQVDLGQSYLLNWVEMVARPDLDQPEARRDFEVVGSNDATFETGVTVLASHGSVPFPEFGSWESAVSASEPLRFVRVRKTVPDAFFNFAEFRVYGVQDTPCDLAIESAVVDVDPSDPDIDAGPGGVGRPLDVVATVKNAGRTTLVEALLQCNVGILGRGSRQVTRVVDDFDPAPGVQGLAPGALATVRLSFAEGQLGDCGRYSLFLMHRPTRLRCADGSTGDMAGFNDRLFRVDVLDLRLATLTLTIHAASQVIEDPATEPVSVDVDFVGLGPGGDNHRVRAFVDVLQGGTVVRGSVLIVSRARVPSNAAGRIVLELGTGGISPPLERGVPYGLRLRVIDRDVLTRCADGDTSNTFTIAP